MIDNSRIRELSTRPVNPLIVNFKEECLQQCSYKLRLGKLILPGGEIAYESPDFNEENDNQSRIIKERPKFKIFCITAWKRIEKYVYDFFNKEYEPVFKKISVHNNYVYKLNPNQIILFQTLEKVNLPQNYSASYSAVDSIAKQGIMLINVGSIVEPCSNVYLGGVLLNFSSRPFYIMPNMEIAKIVFFELPQDADISNRKEVFVKSNYTVDLHHKAELFSETFLDVERLKRDVADATSRSVKKGFVFGGSFLTILLAFATLEPFFKKYIKSDVPENPFVVFHNKDEELQQTNSQQILIDSLFKEIEKLKKINEKK